MKTQILIQFFSYMKGQDKGFDTEYYRKKRQKKKNKKLSASDETKI